MLSPIFQLANGPERVLQACPRLRKTIENTRTEYTPLPKRRFGPTRTCRKVSQDAVSEHRLPKLAVGSALALMRLSMRNDTPANL